MINSYRSLKETDLLIYLYYYKANSEISLKFLQICFVKEFICSLIY